MSILVKLHANTLFPKAKFSPNIVEIVEIATLLSNIVIYDTNLPSLSFVVLAVKNLYSGPDKYFL